MTECRCDELSNRIAVLESWVAYERNKRLSFDRDGLGAVQEKFLSNSEYWTQHTVVGEAAFNDEHDSVASLKRRYLQYPGYEDLMNLGDLSGLRVLDFGCGPGHDLVDMSQRCADVDLYGVDVSSTALAVARQRLRLQGLEARLVEISEDSPLPFDDGFFDVVLCSGVLMHTKRPVATLAELRRVTRTNGFAKVMVYNRDSLWFHLYCGYILKIDEGIGRDLSTEELFFRSTDGPSLPRNAVWSPSAFEDDCAQAGWSARFLGAAPSVYEMSIAPRRFEALRSYLTDLEHLEFLAAIQVDTRGVPLTASGAAAGVDACFELRPS